ncbi:ATP-dependent DNA helicase RecQ [Chlamydia abortus]|nr:ATP-dependent DNA helicase RecQ [Chlamydia abortus]
MNLIFCNTLEKVTEENRVRTALVSIYEEHGEWSVFWNEQAEGKAVRDVWYEGMMWDEALQGFREGLDGKFKEGFVPLIRGTDLGRRMAPRGGFTQMLHYYSEANLQSELFNTLRQWRREQAAKEGKSAFIIATNRILQMLSVFVPHNLDELRQIPGFGEQRLASYGQPLLELLQQVPQSTPFPLDWVKEKVDPELFEQWLEEQYRKKETAGEKKRETKRALLEAMEKGVTLDQIASELAMERRELILLLEELDRDGYDVGPFIEMELQAVAKTEQKQAEKLFRDIGHRYLKPVVQQLYTEDELKQRDVSQIYDWLRLYRLKYRRHAG